MRSSSILAVGAFLLSSMASASLLPRAGGPEQPVCPKPCDIYKNSCAATAPTCVYPSTNSPPYCACRAGYKSKFANDDTTKHWRVGAPSQQDRVWVAEGVECDTLCDQPFGTPSCREVSQLPDTCFIKPL